LTHSFIICDFFIKRDKDKVIIDYEYYKQTHKKEINIRKFKQRALISKKFEFLSLRDGSKKKSNRYAARI
jgi:hypothetical protein